MNATFTVEPLSFTKIQELPNSWTDQNYIDLLDLMDYGDTSDIAKEELKEMCHMFLSDNEPEEATKIVLQYIFGDRLTNGQITNLSNEMLEERMWEEYADLSMHEEFFNVNQLLYQAFSGKFPFPEAVKFKVRVVAKQADGLSIFNKYPEAPLIRLLVAGMPGNTLIYRLFDEQVDGDEFKDAKDIIWQLQVEKIDDRELIFEVISSLYWFHDIKNMETFEAQAHEDDV